MRWIGWVSLSVTEKPLIQSLIMPRPRSLKPAYFNHKASGRAYVSLDGKPVYLGDHGTQASRDEYDRVIGEWIARGRATPATQRSDGTPTGFSIPQLIAAFLKHAQACYPAREGGRAGELDNFNLALRPLRRLYGNTDAADFGPLKLEALRDHAIKPYKVAEKRNAINEQGEKIKVEVEVERPGWSRKFANRQIKRIVHVFRWGVSKELIPPVHEKLAALPALKAGKTEAREMAPVKPVSDADVSKVLPHLSPQLKAMIELESLTGMRPGEVRIMRTGDIDRTDPKVWIYRPRYHKTEHHGIRRDIPLGPRAREVVTPFLKLNPDAHLFSPAEAEAWRREQQRKHRKTDVQPSQVRRGELSALRTRTIPSRAFYSKDGYTQAIRRACKAAGLGKHFTPNQLRHAAATRIERELGLEAAQLVLGHQIGSRITAVYVDENREKARKIMAKIG